MTKVIHPIRSRDRQFSDLSQCNTWLHSNLDEYSAVERLLNGQGDPILLAFAVKEIKDNSAKAHRPRACDSVVEACRWRHLYSPAYIDFPERHDRRPGVLATSCPHTSRLPNEKNEARPPAKLNLGNSNEGLALPALFMSKIKARAEEKSTPL